MLPEPEASLLAKGETPVLAEDRRGCYCDRLVNPGGLFSSEREQSRSAACEEAHSLTLRIVSSDSRPLEAYPDMMRIQSSVVRPFSVPNCTN